MTNPRNPNPGKITSRTARLFTLNLRSAITTASRHGSSNTNTDTPPWFAPRNFCVLDWRSNLSSRVNIHYTKGPENGRHWWLWFHSGEKWDRKRALHRAHGIFAELHGKISLEGYQTVHLDDVIFDRNKKTQTMMKPESFRQLRNQIGTWRLTKTYQTNTYLTDTNIRIARGDSSKWVANGMILNGSLNVVPLFVNLALM